MSKAQAPWNWRGLRVARLVAKTSHWARVTVAAKPLIGSLPLARRRLLAC
jgi:hypothetical protein